MKILQSHVFNESPIISWSFQLNSTCFILPSIWRWLVRPIEKCKQGWFPYVWDSLLSGLLLNDSEVTSGLLLNWFVNTAVFEEGRRARASLRVWVDQLLHSESCFKLGGLPDDFLRRFAWPVLLVVCAATCPPSRKRSRTRNKHHDLLVILHNTYGWFSFQVRKYSF